MKHNKIVNAMTVDVEDYFHVSAFAKTITPDQWPKYECRVENNTQKLLKHFDEHNIKATFFILGWVAERYRHLVQEISNNGHEIACHGYSHQLVYNQTRDTFKEETERAKKILEDIVQIPVVGYRAASYSITEKSRWALDVLGELGFEYDSSIFPIRHDRYGMPDSPKLPHKIKSNEGHTIVEFPLSTLQIFKYVLPIAGGGYFRLFPYGFTRYALSKLNNQMNPFVFYLHPWEIDPEQPRVNAGFISRFRHYNNLERCEQRLVNLLKDFDFTTMKQVLLTQDLLAHKPDREISYV